MRFKPFCFGTGLGALGVWVGTKMGVLTIEPPLESWMLLSGGVILLFIGFLAVLLLPMRPHR